MNGNHDNRVTSNFNSGDDYLRLRWEMALRQPASLRSSLGAWAFEHGSYEAGSALASTLASKDSADLTSVLKKLAQQSDAESQKSLVATLSQPMKAESSYSMVLKKVDFESVACSSCSPAWWQANPINYLLLNFRRSSPVIRRVETSALKSVVACVSKSKLRWVMRPQASCVQSTMRSLPPVRRPG